MARETGLDGIVQQAGLEQVGAGVKRQLLFDFMARRIAQHHPCRAIAAHQRQIVDPVGTLIDLLAKGSDIIDINIKG